MTVVIYHIICYYIIDLKSRRRGWKNNIKVHVYGMFILWCIHGIFVANTWTLG